MKLRFYLRGIGLGILVSSALFISIGFNKKSDMTDAEIKARAKELGMTEKTVLSDLSSEYETESITVNSEECLTKESEKTTTDIEVTTVESEEENLEEPQKDTTIEYTEIEPTDSELTDSEPTENETTKNIVIVVNKGDGSGTVSGKLYEAGLIENAKDFDHYLMQNGYDRRITAGSHEIPTGSTMEQLAKILCNL